MPRQLSGDLRRYIFKRKALMQQIEQRDIQELEKKTAPTLMVLVAVNLPRTLS